MAVPAAWAVTNMMDQHGYLHISDGDDIHGAGIAPGAGAAFKTSKAHGLGLGLALAHSTAERLGGELTAHAADGGGLLQRLRIPLPPNDNRPR